ncbi:uncharacterized protein LOC105176949 isoform X1 [Sesamum indicum]|uniref:Uncharacterized protein LOC105176949 isoform X1 n=2 Tax=Sesamum indicum TaxID=4182 RepID=A0A6I9UHU7_SESIN|nr:uncharacterized protein LOC105176949 isoform X1 [Sesamum indicum]XP_020554382.1 uncharacterized protein LOC105176949 isoform X1 [Sesamum indicum]
MMEDGNHETDLEINYHSEGSMGEKRKREGKLRSKVWQHFTKIMKEDGSCEKCQCNHCRKLFTCSSRSGTTHLLRHITDGICPVFKKEKDKIVTISSYPGGGVEQRSILLPWKFEQGVGQSSTQCMDVEIEPLSERHTELESHSFKRSEDDFGGQTSLPSRGKLPQQSALKSQPKGEVWMNEFRSCVAKLVELTNGKIPVGSLQALAVSAPDYSISAALKCLNEMEDIPQSSEMYLDAFEILKDAEERECFICLPSEPRRRWLQRVLHRRHPLRYSSNI